MKYVYVLYINKNYSLYKMFIILWGKYVCHSFPVVLNISKDEQRQTNITLVHFRVRQMEMPFKTYYILCSFVSMHDWSLSWVRSNSIPEYKKLPQTCIFLRFNLQFCIIFVTVTRPYILCVSTRWMLGQYIFVVQYYSFF